MTSPPVDRGRPDQEFAPVEILTYPVSFVMQLWHSLLSLVVDPDSGVAWVGSVILLVVTIRLLLLRTMWRQQYSLRKMSQLAPQMQKLQKEHKDDRQKQAEEMQKLYSEANVNPLQGCLPFLVQIPVFIGLYWLLLNFAPREAGDPIPEQNGVFGPEQINSFLNAEMFGVPLSAYITMPLEAVQDVHEGLEREQILLVLVPLFLLAGLATFINMRNSFKRQERAKQAEKEAREQAELEERAGGPVVDGEVIEPEPAEVEEPDAVDAQKSAEASESAANTPSTQADDSENGSEEEKKSDGPELPNFAESLQDSMNQTMKLMMYFFPFFPIFGAIVLNFPMAIGLYWFTNNIWTAVQSHIFMEKLERELPMSSREGLPPSAFM